MTTTKLPTKLAHKTCANFISPRKPVLLLILSLILLICPLTAQEDFKPSSKEISLAYFGESITHPGISLGYAQSIKGWDKEKVKKNGKKKIKYYNIKWSNKLAFYHHKRNHNGLLLTTGTDFSITKKKGGYYQLGVLLGTNYKSLNEDVYSVNENQEVMRVNNTGHFTFIYGFGTSIGKHLRFKKSASPLSLFLGSNLFFATPFGSNTIFHNAMELGLKYHL